MPVKVAGNWVPTSETVGFRYPLSDVDTAPRHELGTRVRAIDRGSTGYGSAEFVYLAGGTGVVRGSVCLITDANAVSLIAARDKGGACVALGAVDAPTKWGWFQVGGKGVALCAATVTAATPMYIDNVAGAVDSTAVAGDLVLGMRSVTAADTGTTVVNMATMPAVADFDNA